MDAHKDDRDIEKMPPVGAVPNRRRSRILVFWRVIAPASSRHGETIFLIFVSRGAPAVRPANKGFVTVLASFYRRNPCCNTLLTVPNEFNDLQGLTNHSVQHGGNTAVRFSFAVIALTSPRPDAPRRKARSPGAW